MAKNFPYFKFMATDWLTGNIVFEDLAIQGLFINICALYWQRDGILSIDDLKKRYNEYDFIAKLSDGFISVNNGFIHIQFLDEQFDEINNIRKVNSENGKKGGRPKATAKPKKADKSKEEKKREEKEDKNNNIPPTLIEVCEYFKQKGYREDVAKKAYEYYDQSKWFDSKGKKVKNWKQKMIGVWFKDENKISELPTLPQPQKHYSHDDYYDITKFPPPTPKK